MNMFINDYYQVNLTHFSVNFYEFNIRNQIQCIRTFLTCTFIISMNKIKFCIENLSELFLYTAKNQDTRLITNRRIKRLHIKVMHVAYANSTLLQNVK